MLTSRLAVLAGVAALLAGSAAAQHATPVPDAAALRVLAHAYYEWRDTSYPVGSSDQGRHTWDDRLTDYSRTAVLERRHHVAQLLARVRAASTTAWSRDDRIDWLLFRSQLEGVEFLIAL